MKGCKLCELYEHQHKLLAKNGSNPTSPSRLLNYCSHIAPIRSSSVCSSSSTCDTASSSSSQSASSPTIPPPSSPALMGSGPIGAGSTMAANLVQSFGILQPPPSHFRDMFYATHLFSRGYYQPAGPLISPHVLPSVPPSNASLVSTKQVPSPLDSDPDQLQQPPPSTSAAESSDSEVLITGGDLTTFRYPSQQQPTQSQQLSVLASQQPTQQSSPYSRSMHQMHYPPAYPPSYYSPYPGDAMCYSPPYQPYFPAKVYQSAPAYRRYPSYYQPGHPPPSELYEPPPQSSAAPPPTTGSQLVPAGPTAPQHMEHYPGPPGFYSGYSPGGGQCYTRGMQPPYMEYPPPCPCPMQSCPKNVLTGPLIGSNSSGNNSSTNSSNASNSLSTSINSSNNNNNNSISSNNNSTTNSLNSLSQPLKASKGPVQQAQHPVKSHNHLMGTMEPTTQLSNGSILSKPHLHRHHHHQCKMELLEPLKSDLKTEMNDSIISNDNTKCSQYEEVVVPPTPPSSYTVNDKLIEPEITVSPARGSTGLPTVPDQTDKAASAPSVAVNSPQPPMAATIPREGSETVASINLPSIIGRKARIGKSMAREMMYGARAIPHHHQHHPQIYSHTHIHHHLPSHNPPSEMVKVNPPLSESNAQAIQAEFGKIKEEIKKEDEDVVVILDDEKKIKTEPEIVEVLDDKADSASKDPLSTETPGAKNEEVPRQQNSKRMKILELNKAQCKKSPQNGYKSLIKQADPKPYLCLSRKSEKKDRFSKNNSKGGIRKRKLMLTEQQKKRLLMRKRKLIQERKKQKAERAAKKKSLASAASPVSVESSSREEESRECKTDKSNKIRNNRPEDLLSATPLENTTDGIARGYFSEPEIRTSVGRKSKKSKSSEVRSKSETKKSQQQQLESSVSTPSSTPATTSFEEQNCEQQRHKPKSNEVSEKSSDFNETEGNDNQTKSFKQDGKKRKRESSVSNGKSNKSSAKRAKSSLSESPDMPTVSPDLSQNVVDPAATITINNNILENNNTKFLEAVDDEEKSRTTTPTPSEEIVRSVPTHRHPTKRTRSRSKFGNKRRHRNRHSGNNQQIDPIVIPRKLNVVPRWNNGWSWEGEPFQGKVFLNSDDPLVVRRCYPAMRHSEGDIVRPKDCVLLRAGTKKNELPYVAKVAHLWENPEDGEMMMSLLWYYRPEHTEQGRQSNDNPDEVFASRHRDHNSVACIEDKCYVLTFSEYCRYRRSFRAAEEEIEEGVSIVPPPSITLNFHKVPVSTNPEQVLFCQRVYDFRLRRLMKTSSNN